MTSFICRLCEQAAPLGHGSDDMFPHLCDDCWAQTSMSPEAVANRERVGTIGPAPRCKSEPANDENQNVTVEIRAAEIAAHKFDMQYRLSLKFKTNYGEVAGWRGEETIEQLEVIGDDGIRRTDHDVPLNLDSVNWRAGHLARCIVTHGKEQT